VRLPAGADQTATGDFHVEPAPELVGVGAEH
jgi:hypothetical protein